MKLKNLFASRFRSLREVTIELNDLNVFIGANASGKSTILDVLRFLHEAIEERDFRSPVYSRGGMPHLSWKGEALRRIDLAATFVDDDDEFEWTVSLGIDKHYFAVNESVRQIRARQPPTLLLESDRGHGWWRSGEKGDQVTLAQSPTSCALAAAAADASFPARGIVEFAHRWGFFDPNPFFLRRDSDGLDATRLDAYGRNLGERLRSLYATSPEVFARIVSATQSVLGLPLTIETREAEDRVYFVQSERGLQYPVHQMGVSSGTLRMLALMTALFGETGAILIGIEEPENYIHPVALDSFAEHLAMARESVQLLVTTHSPLLLDFLDRPAAVCVVRKDDEGATGVFREANPEVTRRALQESGFGLGEFYETKGFGS